MVAALGRLEGQARRITEGCSVEPPEPLAWDRSKQEVTVHASLMAEADEMLAVEELKGCSPPSMFPGNLSKEPALKCRHHVAGYPGKLSRRQRLNFLGHNQGAR